jgi:hypothetical protein
MAYLMLASAMLLIVALLFWLMRRPRSERLPPPDPAAERGAYRYRETP